MAQWNKIYQALAMGFMGFVEKMTNKNLNNPYGLIYYDKDRYNGEYA